MATKKKLLQAAAGTAAASGGAGALNVEQVFSTYLYEGNGSSQVIENGINLGQSFGSGSGYFSGSATGIAITGSGEYLQTPTSTDFALSNSDFTIEFFVNVSNGAGNNNIIFSFGAGTSDYDPFIIYTNITSTTADLKFYGSSSGTSWNFVSNALIGTVTFGTWHHVALVRSGGSFYLFLDGVLGSTTSVSTTSFAQSANQILIGRAQNDKRFYGYLSDFHYVKGTALYTSAFTAPTSTLSAVANTKLLILQQTDILSDNSSSSHSMTEVDGSISASSFGPFDAASAGEGGLVWFKQRNGTYNHVIFDTERWTSSNGQGLFTNATNAAGNINELASFNANGFTVQSSGYINDSVSNMASWTFRKAPKFFDVVTYTGDGTTNRQISHNLGTTIGALFIKATSTTSGWAAYHRNLSDNDSSSCDNLFLHSTGAEAAYGIFAPHTSQTDTYFQLYNAFNTSGVTYVAYLFAHNDGDGEFGPTGDQDIIKCGSFTGNGSSTGPEIDLGFEPQWILLKDATNGNTNWNMHDNMRGISVGGADAILYANQNFAENASTARMDITSTGFKMTTSTTGWNASSANMIYIAIRRGPMAVPTDATDVFAIDFASASGDYSISSSFPVDKVLYAERGGTNKWYTFDRVRGSAYVKPNSTDVETTYAASFALMDGFTLPGSAGNFSDYINYMWKRAPNFFDVVAYTGNGTAGRTVSHNLGVAPEMMWVKARNASQAWAVYHSGMGNTKYMRLSDTTAQITSSTRWNDTSPTDSVFTVGTDSNVNNASNNYIAYLFASLDGVSKVGSYTGNGGTGQTIDCGFSSGARFVLIKNYFATGENWVLFDSERGIVSGNDALLSLNTTDAESTSSDLIDPHSSGFSLPNGFGEVNSDGHTYIFYAIA